ncbi:MAG TPA: NADH-quinone oxidoreductase subunit L [Dehalococcoidia bacterium]|jgi:NADH-quinone oxidoreductase subunit L|nr:NADH-quinone oxidoreductase subunit L [Dehalococcoidia bacterium]
MISHQFVWLIFLLPLFSFIIIGLIIRPLVRPESRVAGYITITAIGGSLVLSIWALFSVMAAPHHEIPIPDISWVVVEDGVSIHLGLMLDSLTAVMLIVVTLVSLMVQIYSQGYMHGDPGYHRYYAWMSLFTASMLGLVLADNLVLLFVFWELVGLCSYLLIGFWFHKPSAANAAKKAFIVTRLGDFGFLAGILALYLNTGTFDIAELHELAIAGTLAGTALTWAAIGIFSGAVGKSAQFPLHVWLPDAMEGPTPVSALIHAATMVAAGVFLVARMFPLFEHSPQALTTVAIIGGVTAIFAASMGLVMNDIKRVLAYSTISQLGYMMLGLGTGGVAIGIFHLFNHAFFKALLFLGAGSVNHATGTFDMRQMGGLKKYMPWTYATFVIASLSIAGIWPLSGFWSKDEIVVSALSQPVLFALAMITVFMTAFYMFRAVFMTFGGEYRGGSPEAHGEHHPSHPHESPKVMVIPMVILAVLSVLSGLWNVTGHFGAFMGHGEIHSFAEGFFHPLTQALPWVSLILAGLGILLAYAMYSKGWLSPERIGTTFKPLYTLFYSKYWFDELYEDVIVRGVLLKGLFRGMEQFDSHVVDGAVNTVADGAIAGGRTIRRAQTGQLQLYALFIGIGILAIVFVIYFSG